MQDKEPCTLTDKQKAYEASKVQAREEGAVNPLVAKPTGAAAAAAFSASVELKTTSRTAARSGNGINFVAVGPVATTTVTFFLCGACQAQQRLRAAKLGHTSALVMLPMCVRCIERNNSITDAMMK